MSTPPLLDVLARIQQEAVDACHKFERGLLPSGRTTLRRIEELASDAISDEEFALSADAIKMP